MLVLGTLLAGMPPLTVAMAELPSITNLNATSTPTPKTEPTLATITTGRAALQKEITTTRQELAKLPADGSADATQWLTQESALLERIDAVLAEQQRTWQQAADLAKETTDVGEQTLNPRPAATTFKPPYNLALLDQLYGEREALEQAAETLKRDVDNAETMMQDASDILEEKDRIRRAAREAAGATKPTEAAPGNLRLAELEGRLAQETLLLREKALRTLKLQQSLLEPKQKLLGPRFTWLRENLTLGPEPDPEVQQKRAAEIRSAIAKAKNDMAAAAQTVVATERRAASEKIADELESRRADRQTANLTLSVLTAQSERLDEKAKVTELRRSILSGMKSGPELRDLAKENQANLDRLDRERRRELTALIRSRRELQDWQGQLTQAASADRTAPAWKADRVKRLTAWIQLSQEELADLDLLRTEGKRLQEEIGQRVALFSWSDATALGREKVVAAWNFEMFSVQDQPVRVKTILAVLLLVVLGYYASLWVSTQASLRIFKRLGMNTGRRAAWQLLWFYALFLIVLVTAFNLFHISLTQFSVVSGALAVGIGFGSQNLIGNFISGIILLIERPVNQGDVIEIDGRRMTVERLGARSTIVRTLDNTHMVVPNSRLLDQPVINWTLSDDVVRQQVRVGVAYGSPTRKVAASLQEILAGIEHVLKEPKPFVIFADFGDSSLNFDIYFWARIETRLKTEDELRHRIAEEFAKAEIVIAFPQRDVHLETTKPLQVVITPATAEPPATQVT